MNDNIIEIRKPAEGSGLELLPCPFCGSYEIVYMQYEHVAGLRWKVFCCGCAAKIDPGYAQQQHQVADMWNRRASCPEREKEE